METKEIENIINEFDFYKYVRDYQYCGLDKNCNRDLKIDLINKIKDSQKLSCGKYFKPWGESEAESSWKCGDEHNGKPLLCPECSPTKTSTEENK